MAILPFVSRLCIPYVLGVNFKNSQPIAASRIRAGRLSKDGKWRSFPKLPHLLQYVGSGKYYARVKRDGKIIRQSLATEVWTNAKLKLVDFLKEQQTQKSSSESVTFVDALKAYREQLNTDTAIKPKTREYRELCIRKIELSWPELWDLKLTDITLLASREWAAKLKQEIAGHYSNNTIATLRQIIDVGAKEQIRRGGKAVDNPIKELSRAKIVQKQLTLPEREQFHALVENIRTKSGCWGRRVADLIQFLAFSGMRVFSETQWVNWEDVDWKRKEIIVRGDPVTATKNSEVRRIPLIPDLEALLLRMSEGKQCKGRILEVTKCQAALTRACHAVGIPRITHHDLRHLFATRCIEAGVDIPTVARWLGHKDGGALAMKTYGHLRNEHSQQMAQKVKF